MQYVYALSLYCIVLIIPDTPAEKFPSGLLDIVNPGIQPGDSSHLTCINNINNTEQLIVWGLFVSIIRFCELQKASGITPWKKCYSLLRWPCYYRRCAQQTFTVQNKPAAVAPKETITHHFFVSGIGQKKTVDAAKICGGAPENVVKTETQQTFVVARFYYFRHYTPLEARVYCSQ